MSVVYFEMLVGIPGCGKSTYAKKMEVLDYVWISSDKIREELYGSEEIQGNPKDVFAKMYERTFKALNEGKNVIYDATNIKRKDRMSLIAEIDKRVKGEVYKKCSYFAVDPAICKERNSKRERVVPEEIIDKMLKSFEVPVFNEGWDYISNRAKQNEAYIYDVERARTFEHNNHHHLETVGEHMEIAAAAYIKDKMLESDKYFPTANFNDEIWATLRHHDEGKLYTKVNYRYVKNEKVPSKDSHYYGHANYGAYLFLSALAWAPNDFKNYLWENNISGLDIAALIENHMNFYFWKDSVPPREFIKFWGEEFVEKLKIINKYDKLGRRFEDGQESE